MPRSGPNVYVLDNEETSRTWTEFVPGYVLTLRADTWSKIPGDAVTIVHLSHALTIWRERLIDELLKMSSSKPETWIIVVSGSGINHPDYRSGGHLYFRRTPIGDEADSTFRNCLHHFLQSLNEGSPRTALLEPQRPLLCGLWFLLSWNEVAPGLPLPAKAADELQTDFRMAVLSTIGITASDIDDGIGKLTKGLQQETTSESANAIARDLKRRAYPEMKAAIEDELQKAVRDLDWLLASQGA